MDALLAIIGIIAVIVNAVNKSKKVRQNAPGQAAAPKSAAPAASVPRARTEQTVRPAVQPTIHPTVSVPQSPAADQGSFWQQIGDALQKELGIDTDGADHGRRSPMNEGDSRECEHGAIGGSMPYGEHEGNKKPADQKSAAAAVKRPVRTEYDRKLEANASLYRPAMNAQEMRRAVVMAEILKRPQERMSEQARRWSVR